MQALRAKKIRENEKDSVDMYEMLSPDCFVGDSSIILTKRGDVFSTVKMRGVDPECLDPGSVADVCERFHGVIRGLGAEYRIYQHIIKRNRPELPALGSIDKLAVARERWLEQLRGNLYSIQPYLSVLRMSARHESLSSRLLSKLSVNESIRNAHEELRRQQRQLQSAIQSMSVRLDHVVSPEILNRQQILEFLLQLTNSLARDCNILGNIPRYWLDEYISRRQCQCFPRHLKQGNRFIKVLSLDTIPANPAAHFRDLLAIPCSMTICSEWQRVDNAQLRAEIKKHRRHKQWNKTGMLVGWFNSQPRAGEGLVDGSKTEALDILDKILGEIENRNNFFGRYALTVSLQHEDERELEDCASLVCDVANRYDAKFVEETSNLHNAWLSMIPGNYLHTLRERFLMNASYATSSFLFAPARGDRRNEHLNKPCLNILETNEGTPYFYNLHLGEVGNCLSVGAVGSGKSFGMNADVDGLQKYNPCTVIFDIGGSYRALTNHHGGSYLHVGERSEFTINPCSLPPTEENIEFLGSFIRMLIEQSGDPLKPEEEEDLFNRIESMYRCDPSQRRLSYIADTAAKSYNMRLANWVHDGHLAHYFDNEIDNLTLARFQTFEFEKMTNPQVLEAIFYYVLQRTANVVYDRKLHNLLKVVVFDEAHEFLSHARPKGFIHRGLKEWRKRNGIILLATQSASDLVTSGLADTAVEQCMTKKLYPNPGMDEDVYRELFKLTKAEAALVPKLNRGQFLLHQTHGSKVLNLNVDPYSFQVFANKELNQ